MKSGVKRIIVNQVKPQITLEEFLTQSETKPAREYINKNITEKPLTAGHHSFIQGHLVMIINQIARPEKIALALLELRCTFGGISIVSDISVLNWSQIPKNEQGKIANRFHIHLDWVIEILSPEQSANQVMRKIIFCLNQGIQLGWLIDPEDISVMIFRPNQLPEIKVGEDILPVLDSLKELQLSVKETFSWLDI